MNAARASSEKRSQRDRTVVRTIIDVLERVEPGTEPLSTIVPMLCEGLGTESSAFYTLEVGLNRWAVDRLTCAGTLAELPNVRRDFQHIIEAAIGPWGAYNPLVVETEQRNTPIDLGIVQRALDPAFSGTAYRGPRHQPMPTLGPFLRNSGRTLDRFRALPCAAHLSSNHQLRILLTEGEAMLGWLGVWRADSFSAREMKVLAALQPALTQRLRLERALAQQRRSLASLEVLLSVFPQPAMILDERGTIQHCNEEARKWLRCSREELLDALRKSLARVPDAPWVLFAVAEAGVPRCYLALGRPSFASDACIRTAAEDWGLQLSQTALLARLTHGQSICSAGTALRMSAEQAMKQARELCVRAEVGSVSALARAVEARGAQASAAKPPALSAALLEVAKLVAEGHSDKEIAGQTKRSVSTIRTYVQRIYERMEVHNRVQLANALAAAGTVLTPKTRD